MIKILIKIKDIDVCKDGNFSITGTTIVNDSITKVDFTFTDIPFVDSQKELEDVVGQYVISVLNKDLGFEEKPINIIILY